MGDYYCSIREGEIIQGIYQVVSARSVLVDVIHRPTGRKTTRSLPLMKFPPCPLPEDYDYYQITGINDDGLATIIRHPHDREENRISRTYPLSSDKEKEKIRQIKELLEREDQAVFCTVVKILGTEVLANIYTLPKDPAILRMPELVQDVLWKYLDYKDLLSLRLVSKKFAHEFLPIHKFWRILDLDVDLHATYVWIFSKFQEKLQASGINFWKAITPYITEGRPVPMFHKNVLLSQLTPEFLEGTNKLILDCSSSSLKLQPELLEKIINNCTQIENFRLIPKHDFYALGETESESGEQDHPNYLQIMETVALKSHKFLVEVALICLDNTLQCADLTFDCSLLSSCQQLQGIRAAMGGFGTLRSLESLQPLKNLRVLILTWMKVPLTKNQLVWISKNLNNLDVLEVHVAHHCEFGQEKTDEDEVDEHVIHSILDDQDCSLPKLVELVVLMGYCNTGIDGRESCTEVARIWNETVRLQELVEGEKGFWYSKHTRCIRETNTAPGTSKLAYQKSSMFREDEDDAMRDWESMMDTAEEDDDDETSSSDEEDERTSDDEYETYSEVDEEEMSEDSDDSHCQIS